MKKTLWMILFAAFLSTGTISITGCQEGPLEEAAEEIEDEVDDATDDR